MSDIQKYIVVETHISNIFPGDTILWYGGTKTVGKRDIHIVESEYSLFGDSYMLGYKPVQKVLFPKFIEGKFIGYR